MEKTNYTQVYKITKKLALGEPLTVTEIIKFSNYIRTTKGYNPNVFKRQLVWMKTLADKKA